MRAFIAVRVPDEIRKQVSLHIAAHRRKNLPIKWVADENLRQQLQAVIEDLWNILGKPGDD